MYLQTFAKKGLWIFYQVNSCNNPCTSTA